MKEDRLTYDEFMKNNMKNKNYQKRKKHLKKNFDM